MKILVLDDEDGIRGLIRESLEMDGHEIFEARNGALGVQIVQESRPDLIISDIRMPEMSGDEFFELLRTKEPEISAIPFIFMSGHVSDVDIVNRLNNGAFQCIRKPVPLKLLRAHVNSWMSGSELIYKLAKKKLSIVEDHLPQFRGIDFKKYRSLSENFEDYADSIVSVLKKFPLKNEEPEQVVVRTAGSSGKNGHGTQALQLSRLCIVQNCLKEMTDRKQLLKKNKNEALSWQMIYLAIEAQLLSKDLFVSDLYVAANAAKSTVNSHINALMDEEIFEKLNIVSDGRRKKIVLSLRFSEEVYAHIDALSCIAVTN